MEQIEIQKLFGVKGKNVLITGGGAGWSLLLSSSFFLIVSHFLFLFLFACLFQGLV